MIVRSPLDLICLHLALECVGLNEHNRLVRLPGPNPDTLHRVYVARHSEGDSVFFQDGLPEDLQVQLAGLPVTDFFESPDRIRAILAANGPCEEIHVGRSYVFPTLPDPDDFTGVVDLAQINPHVVEQYDPGLVGTEKEVFCILCDGLIASTCESSRENEWAGEAWVRTLPEYRRRGFARQVTAAWGNRLIQQGKVPFYSHRWENTASQAVARSLGLFQYIADAGYA